MRTKKTGTEESSLEKNVALVRKHLKERLMVKRELRGFKDERRQLLGILERTVLQGQSDSVLIIGPPASGKTTMVKSCLGELRSKEGGEEGIVIELSGVVHRDDNLALKEIIRGLHLDEERLEGDRITGSFSENLLFLLQSLNSGQRELTRPIIFILDQFELFTSHRNQTLLYNLFDIAQSAQAPICVIGLTTRIDITELLEKRVKSRYSHRQILMFPSTKLEDRLDLVREYLELGSVKEVEKGFIKEWNKEIDSLLAEPKLVQLLRRQLELDSNEVKLKNLLFLLVSRLRSEEPLIKAKDVIERLEECFLDAKVLLLKDLSVMELSLVIAIGHQAKIYDNEPFNFEMIAARYMKFATQYSVQGTQRETLLKCFERLEDLGLILAVGGGSRCFKKEYQLYSNILTQEQIKEATSTYPGLPTELSQWAFSIVT